MKRVCIISALALAFLASIASAQPTGELLKTLDQLTEQNRLLANQNQQLMEQIESLRQAMGTAVQTAPRDASYNMTNVDRDVKYLGFPLDGIHYWRWLGSFRSLNTVGLKGLFDHGFEAQTSMILTPKALQPFGQYGASYDFRAGFSFFPSKDRSIHKSPVGHAAVPFALGSTRLVYDSTAEPVY